MLRPDGCIVGFHELAGGLRDLGAARDHPRHDAHALREHHDALGHGLPQGARDGSRIKRHDERQRDDVLRMRMVDHTAGAVGGGHANAMVHEVRGELAGGNAAVLQAPHDAPCVAGVVDLDDAHVGRRVELHVAHIAARARGGEECPAQIVGLHAHGHPAGGVVVEERAARANLFIGQAIRQVTAVALVPALVPAIGAQAHERLHKRLLLHGHARNGALGNGDALVEHALRGLRATAQHVLRAIQNTHVPTFPSCAGNYGADRAGADARSAPAACFH